MTGPADQDPAGALLVADSFRVRAHDGRAEVRGWPLHLARFRAAVSTVAPARTGASAEALGLDAFLADAAERIAAFGPGFPRLELRAGSDAGARGPGLGLELRPLPRLTEELAVVTVAAPAVPDAAVKGPNIARYGELNRSSGAETLLLDPDGAVREGATTSVLAWDGGTLLVAPSADRVPSVCERLVREVAASLGVPVAARPVHRAELGADEVWAVNALHGIRPITSIDGAPAVDPDPARLARFRTALDRTWVPVR